ncbi:ABC transporter ATP-binding protein, partial [Azospirillum brasilense]|nr:ABC transporter ATP-binding protein [Azospirillum brasilense]
MSDSAAVAAALRTEGADKAALRLDGVTCTFPSPDGRGQTYTAGQGVTLSVAPGECGATVGATATGQTTVPNRGGGGLAPRAAG